MLYGYVRVSTNDQRPYLQEDALANAGVRRENIYGDKKSGGTRDREELQVVLDKLRKGDVLVVWKLDRLSRSLAHIIEIVTIVESKGAQFKSLTESLDTSTPTGRLVFHMFASLAECERGLIKERTIAGLKAARDRGVRLGRPTKYSAKTAKQILHLREIGLSGREIGDMLGIGRASVYNYLKEFNPKWNTLSKHAQS